MSDLQVCSAPNDSGFVLRDDRPCRSTSLFQSFPVVSNSISRENLEIAERRTDEILCRIRPTVVADKNRREVINYVYHLITASLGCEVFPYGSVPLKTYLLDGDIDLTAISNPNIEESLVSDVHAVLRGEELNKSCHFQVKDVHCIDAEVKLVKCLVENIVVDISFNQLGGLCTLCFLEKVDGLVGKGHLFKRSIILIKAWSYYESRILGAHHGLISTYALETLILCIFHLFHSSLDGPLAVLYRFLDYFSKFDWENYCVSLNGPVCKSSLSGIAATRVLESRVDNLLLSEEFLQECVDKFSVPSRGIETNSRAFPQKHLNIIDALKGNNNLGRSVTRGNFYRIRSAFKFGARKLGQILMLPCERLADELNKFFANTLERHESQHWTDFLDFAGSVDHSSSTQDFETCCEDDVFLNPSTLGYSNKIARFRNNQKRNLLKVASSPYQNKLVSSQAVPDCISDGNAISEGHLAGVVKEVVVIGILSSRSRNDPSCSLPLSSDIGTSLCGKSECVPPHCSRKIDSEKPCGRTASKSLHDYDTSFALWPDSKENSLLASSSDSKENSLLASSLVSKENSLLASSSVCSCGIHESIVPKNFSLSTPILKISERSSSVRRERSSASISGTSEPSKSLLDLSGHYESYFSSLIYGKHYYLSAPALLSPMSHQLQNKNLWKAIWQSLELESQVYSNTNTSGGSGHQFSPVNSSMSSNPAFSSNEKYKPRGLGTYFPKMNHVSNRDRPLLGRERCQAHGSHGQLQRYTHKNGLILAPTEMNLCGEGSHELSQEDYPVLGNGKSYRPHPSVWGSSNASGLSLPLERESGSHGHQLRDVPLPEVSTQPASDTSYWFDSVSSLVVHVAQGPNLAVERNQERVTEQSYHLKNEVDFPPLSH